MHPCMSTRPHGIIINPLRKRRKGYGTCCLLVPPSGNSFRLLTQTNHHGFRKKKKKKKLSASLAGPAVNARGCIYNTYAIPRAAPAQYSTGLGTGTRLSFTLPSCNEQCIMLTTLVYGTEGLHFSAFIIIQIVNVQHKYIQNRITSTVYVGLA